MPSANHLKGLSYRFAFRQITLAIEQKFYLEAITLCESIISDRLISFISGKSKKSVDPRTSLKALIDQWAKLAESDEAWNGDHLPTAVNHWREARNIAVHCAVKSAPGKPTQETSEYVQVAKAAAYQGKKLARDVCVWHKSQLLKAVSENAISPYRDAP